MKTVKHYRLHTRKNTGARRLFAKRLFALLLCFALTLTALTATSCATAPQTAVPTPENPFQTFRDIPDITPDEIAAIEKLQARGDPQTPQTPLIYAAFHSTELFERNDGTLGGYTVLFCGWLSELIEIPIQVEMSNLSDMIEDLNSGAVDLVTISATPVRLAEYYMSDAIVQRVIKTFRYEGSQSLTEISQKRLPRYAFVESSAMIPLLADTLEAGTYEEVIVADEEGLYQAVKNGDADAFILADALEAAFDEFDGIYTEDFLPPIFLHASVAANNPDYEAVISVITKAVQGGAANYLSDLHKQGYRDYRRNRLTMMLSGEEIEYLWDNPAIPFATYYASYPISFYNEREGKWDGIVFDIMAEIQQLTGLNFEIAHEGNLVARELMALLESEAAYFMPNLTITPERLERFDWLQKIYFNDRYALLSKQSYPNIELNDVLSEKVGVVSGTAFAEALRTWFPDALHITEYPSEDDAFIALDKGEVNLVMSMQSRLLALTNYHELSDYKVNYLFSSGPEITFAVNKNQTVLYSILDKALSLIDTDRIVEQWNGKTYNIEAAQLRAQRPWLIGIASLTFAVLVLVVLLFQISRKASAERAAMREAQAAEKIHEIEEEKQVIEEEQRHLREIQERLRNAILKEQEANQLKSRFLAHMSHEIRTPMNAVIGMTELALREENHDIRTEHMLSVKKAGASLLAIINDILDFSKIEAGKMVIVPDHYSLPSMLGDVVSIIRMRAADSQIRFAVKADSKIPQTLYGDEMRIRQALLNILGNAVKYTEKGFVSLGVFGEFVEDDTINLVFEVTDSGIGIKPEDMDKLFADFTQLDLERNRGIEGIGLGLAIAKSFVNAMGGEITARSEYGRGSTFTITVPQKFYSREPLASVRNPQDISTLIFEESEIYADSLSYAFGNLGVGHTLVATEAELIEKLGERAYDFLFISYALYTQNENKVQALAKDAKIVMLAEFGETVPAKHRAVLSMPVYCTYLADMLCGVNVGRSQASSDISAVKFTAPDAKVLIVDDIKSNQRVAQGLLMPYKMQIDLADSGQAAIEAVSATRYDLVFMDHKMPGMDGVEATKRIRQLGGGALAGAGGGAGSGASAGAGDGGDPYYINLPIIALTANAVSGSAEMFLGNGLDDFLPKPINTVRLNAILEKWLPKNKQRK